MKQGKILYCRDCEWFCPNKLSFEKQTGLCKIHTQRNSLKIESWAHASELAGNCSDFKKAGSSLSSREIEVPVFGFFKRDDLSCRN